MTYADDIRAFIKSNARAEMNQQHSASYSGSQHVHYGLYVPVMRNFVRDWVKAHKATLTYDEWRATLDALYRGDSVEEKIIAAMLLGEFPKFRAQMPLAQLDLWLNELTGWAEVDSTCQSIFTAKEMLPRWDEWQVFLRELAADPNINKRRASLVLLIRPMRESSDAHFLLLAFENIERLSHERDILITKAISWLLREAVKQHHAAISQFVESHAETLPKIALREVHVKLTTGKKTLKKE